MTGTSSLAPQLARRCYLCGCLLRDAAAVPTACAPCRRGRCDYNPTTDPVFDRALEELFLRYPGVVVRPCLALGISATHKRAVASSVRRLRRRGMAITGVPHSGGYVYEP